MKEPQFESTMLELGRALQSGLYWIVLPMGVVMTNKAFEQAGKLEVDVKIIPIIDAIAIPKESFSIAQLITFLRSVKPDDMLPDETMHEEFFQTLESMNQEQLDLNFTFASFDNRLNQAGEMQIKNSMCAYAHSLAFATKDDWPEEIRGVM